VRRNDEARPEVEHGAVVASTLEVHGDLADRDRRVGGVVEAHGAAVEVVAAGAEEEDVRRALPGRREDRGGPQVVGIADEEIKSGERRPGDGGAENEAVTARR